MRLRTDASVNDPELLPVAAGVLVDGPLPALGLASSVWKLRHTLALQKLRHTLSLLPRHMPATVTANWNDADLLLLSLHVVVVCTCAVASSSRMCHRELRWGLPPLA